MQKKIRAPRVDLSVLVERQAALDALPDHVQLDPAGAAEVLAAYGVPYTPKTLAKIRCVSSQGPAFKKVAGGRVVYTLGALRQYAGVCNEHIAA